jgi:hypothetical protein
MSIKLNVLLAKTDHLASQFKAMIRDYSLYFHKGDGFKGVKNTYEPLPGTQDYPSERKHVLVTTTVDEKLKYFVETSTEYLQAKFNQEATNASGTPRAKLVVGGVIWGEFSSLELLALKSMLENKELDLMYQTIPVFSDAEEWGACTVEAYTGRAIVQSPLVTGYKKTLDKESYILPDPNVHLLKDTAKYTPMVAEKTTTRDLGQFSFQKFSGEWSPRKRAELLRRKTALLNAVIEALKIANEAAVTESDLKVANIFVYLHGE